ncbi:MAG: AmmeMemoRadiSam system protein A [Candidatus Rokubacteria bacterium]|nr:AmmeMemoRadiSam system protein A [Candidatus Rokubacteria bacterium]
MDAIGSQALWLARQSVEYYVRSQALLPPPTDPPPLLRDPGAAFVTLRLGKALRGCIGTLGPTKPTLAHEIMANAVAAASSDPRFPPVAPSELVVLLYEVDILGALEPIPDEGHLDPDQYGVVVEAGGRRGVLLPAIEGVTTPSQQVAIAKSKALIRPSQAVTLYRFTVTRFREEGE